VIYYLHVALLLQPADEGVCGERLGAAALLPLLLMKQGLPLLLRRKESTNLHYEVAFIIGLQF
jgi:hypothetical protein